MNTIESAPCPSRSWRVSCRMLPLVGVMASIIAIAPARATSIVSEAAFLAQVGPGAGHLGFDALPAGSDLSGATLNFSNDPHVTLKLPTGVADESGATMSLRVIGADSPTSSPPNSLGTDDVGNFGQISAGTRFSFGLTTKVTAFGLSFVSPDELLDGDIRLIAGAEQAVLSAAARSSVGTFGGLDYYAYFLGVLSPTAFDIATIDYDPAVSGVPFLYTIDDIRVAGVAGVPEPGGLALVVLALSGALGASARRRCADSLTDSKDSPEAAA